MAYKIRNQWLSPDKYGIKSPRTMKPEGIVLHNTSNTAPAINEASYMTGNNNEVSFHAVIDEKEVVQCVPFIRVAHHAGNYAANSKYIGLEVARSSSSDELYFAAERNAIEYIAHIFVQYGWTDVNKHLRFHREFFNTACPVRIPTSRYASIRKAVADKIAEIKSGATTDKPPVKDNAQPPGNTQSPIKEADEMAVKLGKTQQDDMRALLQRAYDDGTFSVNHAGKVADMTRGQALDLLISYVARKAE